MYASRRRRGLGTVQSIQSDIALGGAAAGIATAAAALPSIGLLAPAVAGPIGLAIAGVAMLSSFLVKEFSGCGQTCVVASQNANEIEAAMKANLAAFQAGQIDQATAEANFNALWQQQVQMCAQVGGPNAAACVSDRQAGACKWKDSSGACWNWFSGYYDPIANAPQSVSIFNLFPSTGSGSSWLPWAAGAALLLGVML